MAYNTYVPYQPYYRNPYIDNQQFQYQTPMNAQQQPPTAQSASDIIWVQGEAGAKAYLVAPNTTVTLWDSETPTIYVKTSDARGIPSMRVLDFKERSLNAQNAPNFNSTPEGGKSPLSDEIDALRGKYDALSERLSSLEKRLPKSAKTKDGDAE